MIYNLGGPDSPDAIRPFLQNLFSDPMILRVPGPVRAFLSRFIAWRRAPVAQEIYAQIGGRSPILPETEKQVAALQKILGDAYRVFIAMRYWHPFAAASELQTTLQEQIVHLRRSEIIGGGSFLFKSEFSFLMESISCC